MRWILFLTALSIVLPACRGPDRLATPNLIPPFGSVDHQQARAQVFEPFPENEPGPPVVGARPREYQDPRAEVLRVQPRIGEPILTPCPQMQIPIAQPTIVTPPPAIYNPPGTAP
ncbi:MAG: hypothetical protein WCJ35_21680 [Planctomycetota bacterium]